MLLRRTCVARMDAAHLKVYRFSNVRAVSAQHGTQYVTDWIAQLFEAEVRDAFASYGPCCHERELVQRPLLAQMEAEDYRDLKILLAQWIQKHLACIVRRGSSNQVNYEDGFRLLTPQKKWSRRQAQLGSAWRAQMPQLTGEKACY